MFTARKEKGKKIPCSLLFKLTAKTVLFLFLSLLLFLIFYLAGNYLEYLDESIDLILAVSGITGTAIVFFGTAGAIESIIFLCRNSERRAKYLMPLIFFLSSTFFAAAVLVVFASVDILSEGF